MINKSKFIVGLAILQFVVFHVCGILEAKEIYDQTGRLVSVPDNPQRVIALAPSITEIIYELGQEDKLVGATRYSDYPAPALKIPRVGSYVRLDIEKIISLKPDLCLAIKDGNPEHTIDRIEALGVPVYIIDPRNMNDIISVIQGFGVLLNSENQAASLIQEMTQRLNQIKSRISGVANIPQVFIQVDAEPIITAGHSTFVNELIYLAGGSNLADKKAGYYHSSWEDVLVLLPDVVIIASMAGGQSREDLKSNWNNWSLLPAVKNKRIHVIDTAIINRPTPRLIDGLEKIVKFIHPELDFQPGFQY